MNDRPAPEGGPGTDEQRPRWEGPPENRPRGYLPADDDPAIDRDAAGENLADPQKRNLSDAFDTRRGTEDDLVRHLVETTDVSPLQAREIVARHGGDRREAIAEARLFKAES